MRAAKLALLLAAALSPYALALSCPGTAGLFYDGTSGAPYCCPGVRLTGTTPPTCNNRFTYQPTVSCTWALSDGQSLRTGDAGFEVDAGIRLYNFRTTVVGGKGEDVGAHKGGSGAYVTLQMPGAPLPFPLKASILLNIADGQEVDLASPSIPGIAYGRGGGYSAVANADCVAGRPSLQFTPADECRWIVASGGGGASQDYDGVALCDRQPYSSTPANPLLAGRQASSAGAPPLQDAQGRYISGGGGGGIVGGGPAVAPFNDPAYESSAPGCGGTFGLLSNSYSFYYTGTITSSGPAPLASLTFQYTACQPLVAETATTPSVTVTETSSRSVDETVVPGATVTSTTEDLTTATPSTSSLYTTTDVYTTPPTSIIDVTETRVTTPLTSTIAKQTTVTTETSNTRTPVATAYKTEWVASEPPTSTLTAVQTVSTGYADCTTYRIAYPSKCCPSRFMTLSSLAQQPQRRTVHLQARTLTDTSTIFEGETTTTVTVDYTQTLTAPDETVLTTSTRVVEAETPLTIVTSVRTLEAPTPLRTSTHIVYSEAPTPLVTSVSTRFVAPRRPFASVQALLNPTTTLTLTSTSELPTRLATTTVTEEVQGTACAETVVKPFTRCFFDVNGAGDLQLQARQRALLDEYRTLSGRAVTVDCGAGGVFPY
ncbi:hypothetical protein JCM10449v2_006879 [Rhodotorula kratochvilovae]